MPFQPWKQLGKIRLCDSPYDLAVVIYRQSSTLLIKKTSAIRNTRALVEHSDVVAIFSPRQVARVH